MRGAVLPARRTTWPAAAAAVVALVVAVVTLVAPLAAHADRGDEFAGGTVIFARGSALYRIDARGRGETLIATLGSKVRVRTLRSDATGSALLADLGGAWAWMPLDGQARALIDLPCADGPAQLAEDGSAVLCRSPSSPGQAMLVELGPGAAPRIVTLPVPPGAVRLVGSSAERKLVWADSTGVWTAAIGDVRHKTRAAKDVPLRGFLPGPDGEHAVGVFADQIYADVHHTRPAELLMLLALDGEGARRKTIAKGIAVEWSHDARWVLVQDGANACIMRASGGQYKCWRGYTAASISSDGRWALALGNRNGTRQIVRSKPAKGKAGKPARGKPAAPEPDEDVVEVIDDEESETSANDMPWDHLDDQSDESEAGEPPPGIADVVVAAPSGPQSLFRLRLEGANTDRPVLLTRAIDGAAVWIPSVR